ncbi:Kinesin light chain [Hondaea fermentalgiana]|uniref:Kinesin light chain n=1 Tax=Hondaea fermentalgiana TaxID=2315210 RepID=A0A2R5GF64_9STRA|nr:Kinesin light chain [Hondaea fermentalgiana]|eukprot:GBG28969.1 Kinesin light chain [Hondaea fermentalgiana]
MSRLRSGDEGYGTWDSSGKSNITSNNDLDLNNNNDLSNDIVCYRGISVTALQKIWQDVLDEVLAADIQLTVIVRKGKRKGRVANVDGMVNFDPGQDAQEKLRKDWTVEDVCANVVLSTKSSQSPGFYLDVLLGESNDQACVGPPFRGAFISQARKCSFGELVESIVAHYQGQDRDLTRTYVWLDLFSANQPNLTAKDSDLADGVKKQYEELLQEGLHVAIERFEERLIFFDRWEKPSPLKRMWCVWEIYGAIKCGKSFTPIFAPGEDERFVQLMEDETPRAITTAFAALNMANAECFSSRDRDMIDEAVKSIDGGYSALNAAVLAEIRRWLVLTSHRIVEARKTANGSTAEVAVLMYNVAWLLRDQGQYDVALKLHQEVLQIRKKTLGTIHPLTSTTMHNMASVLYSQGQYDVALKLYQEVLEIEQESTMACTAGVLDLQGQYDAAVELYQEALKIRKEKLGREHPLTATVLHNMASVLYSQGKYDAALKWYQDALEIRMEKLGLDHALVAATRYWMSFAFSDLERFAEALEAANDALEILRLNFPSDDMHPRFGYAWLAKGRALLGLGDSNHAEAVSALELSVEIREMRLGPDHDLTAASLYWLAVATQDADMAQRALEIRRQKLGDGHPLTVKSREQAQALTA